MLARSHPRRSWLAIVALTLACGPSGFTGGGSTTLTTETSGEADTSGDGDPDSTAPAPGTSSNVDVLIVLDNSGSMGNSQVRLANAIDALVDALDEADADYRVAVTTSDNGNVWCPVEATSPEAGRFVLSPCHERLDDFLYNSGALDATQVACLDICPLTSAELEIVPSTTAVDATPRPRPWVERIDGQTNLPAGTELGEALRCLLPMGISGCGFESQLESMHLGLLGSQDPAHANFGFLRPDSVVAVLLVSDEVDCSDNLAYEAIFAQDGNKVFWADPSDTFPSSAVCWNAGVTCQGDPNSYDSCVATNKDVDGNEGVPDADAVLHPLSRYRALLDGLEAQIQQLQPGREIVLGLIAGVGPDGAPIYADALDPDFQASFGVGAGCLGANPLDLDAPLEAVPPVRMYELVEGLSAGSSHSICAEDFSDALAAFAGRITQQLP